MSRLTKDFFLRDVLQVAPDLIGKQLVVANKNNIARYLITDVEAYRGEEDLACHASKGRTPRTEIMYHSGGHLYVYLIYGMYWMLNVVTGKEKFPQAVLIRGIKECNGPGRVGKLLNINKSYYGESLLTSNRIWIEGHLTNTPEIVTTTRIGIDYSGEIWKNKPWRFFNKSILT